MSVKSASLYVVLSMGATLAWATSFHPSPPVYSPLPASTPPTYPPPPSPAPTSLDTLEACLGFYPELSTAAKLVKYMPMNYQLNSSATSITLFMPTDKAFRVFAASYGVNLTDGSALSPNTPFWNMLLSVLRYHVHPHLALLEGIVEGSAALYSTDLGSSLFAQLNVTVYKNTDDDKAANITVYGTSSAANVLQYDIRCGSSSINIIDRVLQYWYDSVYAALTAYKLNKLRDGLQKTNLTSVLASGRGTIFAPDDNAFDEAQALYGYNFDTIEDTLRYHLVPTRVLLPQSDVLDTDFPTRNNKTLRVTTFSNGSEPVVSTWITGGVRASISLPAIPVSNGPLFYIYIINRVLIPTYTNVLQAVSNQTGFEFLQALVASDASASTLLSGPSAQKSITLFAPTDQAIRAYATKEYGSNFEASKTFKDRLNRLLMTHIVLKSLSLGSLRNLTEEANAARDKLRFNATLEGMVTVRTEYTSATTMTPANVSILYGRSYFHTISDVLSPFPHNNGSGSAAPSLLVLGLSLLVARLLAALQ